VLGGEAGMAAVDAFYSGYGEESDDQAAIASDGNAFLDAEFPLLARVVSMRAGNARRLR